jgi:ArsR family transcriptional regulator, lead/cadmium/zinc/bismuth-responsive transcriptional repressor
MCSPSEACDELNTDPERVAEARARLVVLQTASDLADTFKALADPTRVRLISALTGMEFCVGELASALNMSISAVSHQLHLLRRLRIVRYRREGKHVFYALDDEHIRTIYGCGLEHIRHS